MTELQAQTVKPRRLQARFLFILVAVGLAVAIPILPLRFLGIPGPDFPDVSQVVTTSKNWLSKVAFRIDGKDETTHAGMPPPLTATPAEQVKMLETAADELDAEIEKSPCDPSLQNRMGLVYVSLGDADRGREHFQKAISLSRLGLTALTDKISSLRCNGRTKEAAMALIEASKLNVELSAAHSNLARLFEKRGEHDKVIAELDLLNKEGVLFDNTVVPEGAGARPMLSPQVARDLARAEALLQARQVPQAAVEYRRVLAQDPNVAMAHHRLGTIMLMSNQAGPAVDELEKAVALEPNLASAHYGLGTVLMQTKSYMPAVQEFKQTLVLQPSLTQAQIKMDEAFRKAGMTVGSAQALN